MVQPITRVFCPSRSPRATADYAGFFWFTWITPDYSNLLGLLEITSGYSDSLRITLDSFGLLVRITKWSSGLPELFAPRVHRGLLRITPDFSDLLGLRRIIPDYSNLLGLLEITSGYSDSLRITSADLKVVLRITRVFRPSRSPRATADYAGLFRFTWITTDYLGLQRFTWITRDYLGLLRFTPDYSGFSRITSSDHQVVQQITRVFCPQDYRGLRQITPDYFGLLRFTWITPDYSGLPVQITKWSSGLPELFPPRRRTETFIITWYVNFSTNIFRRCPWKNVLTWNRLGIRRRNKLGSRPLD